MIIKIINSLPAIIATSTLIVILIAYLTSSDDLFFLALGMNVMMIFFVSIWDELKKRVKKESLKHDKEES